MDHPGQETEAKFCVRNLKRIQQSLNKLQARLVQPRILEVNLRFDTPEQALQRSNQVLRLRQDSEAHLTYKGDSQWLAGARTRREIEFNVEDFKVAREFLEAVGYQVSFRYEKYRTTYELEEVLIMLDELPYGDFVEIEGDVERLRGIADKLSLAWEAAIPVSYHALFERLSKKRGFDFHDLSFERLKGLEITLDEMEIRLADRGYGKGNREAADAKPVD